MPTKAQLESALRNADKAGDTAAAKKLANAIKAGQYDDAQPISPQQMSGEVPVMPDQQAQVPDVYAPQPEPERPLGERIMGGIEAGASMIPAGIAGTAGAVVGAAEGALQYLADGDFSQPPGAPGGLVETRMNQGAQRLSAPFTPPSEAGREYAQAAGEAMAPIAGAAAGLAPMSAGIGQALRSGARQAAPMAQRGLAQMDQVVSAANEKIKGSIARRSTGQGESAGAAITPEAQQRIATAESLPVPVKLTKGAALREAEQLAFEKEQMKTGFGAPLRNRIEENNLQILQNFDEMIDRSGAQALYSGKAETGRSVVRSLSQGLDEAKAKVRQAYRIADESPESQVTANHRPVMDYINSQITGEPSVAVIDSVRKYLTKNNLATKDGDNVVVTKPLNVKQMEEIRQVINQHVTDNSPDIRQATILKRLIDQSTDEVAGPLYKKARALRSQQARIFENRAIIARLLENKKGTLDPKVPLDKVFDKTILTSSPREINTIRRVLNAHGEPGRQAWRDLQGATVDYIREQATRGSGTDSNGNPIVSTAQLNRVINNLDSNGRLDVIFGKQQAQVIRDLNDVVKYVNTVPPGTLINTSGTAATLLAAMGEMGVTGAATGLPVPVIATLKMVRDKARDRKIKKQIQDTLDYSAKVSAGENPQ